MAVLLRGSKYHYRFNYLKKCYSGVCVNCFTVAQAEEYEKKIRAEVANIRSQRTVVALVENYRYELSGGHPILLTEGFDESLKKPSRRNGSEAHNRQKRNYWNDFTAFMAAEFPEIKNMAEVRRSHCEGYIRYLQDHGRFIKEVKCNVRCGKRRGKTRERVYTRGYKLAPKTIVSISRACSEVFSKLLEDAGLIHNPWKNIVLPEVKPIPRDIFSEEELALIKEGIKSDVFCRPLFVIAAATGLTEGDICTLTWEEVFFAEGVIRHTRRKTGVPMEIPMINGLAAFLEGLPRTGQYILPEHAKMYLNEPSGVSYRIIKFLQGLGIKTAREVEGRKAVSVKDLHSMRHVFCYYAGMAGIPLATVQSIVGHLTPEMTRHYQAHVTLAAKRKAAGMLPSLLWLDDAPDSSEAALRRQLADMAWNLPIERVREMLQIA